MEVKNDKDKQEISNVDAYKYISKVLNVGLSMALSILFFTFAGFWLDKKFATEYIFKLVGIFIGIFGGFYNTYKILSKF